MIRQSDIKFKTLDNYTVRSIMGNVALEYSYAVSKDAIQDYGENVIDEAKKLIAAHLLEAIYGDINKAIRECRRSALGACDNAIVGMALVRAFEDLENRLTALRG